MTNLFVKVRTITFVLLFSAFVSNCHTNDNLSTRIKNAQNIAECNNFQKRYIKTGDFTLTTYQRVSNKNSPFVFYIEGDGHISEGGCTIADNPTPVTPMLIRLAGLDHRMNVVYIARPCQYTPLELNAKCVNNRYWVESRMGEEVVNSINYAINSINNGQKFSLVGFSGGGGLVVTIAARNNHVKDILTIAGNLDTTLFDKYHNGRGRLTNSLNPINYAQQINKIPQLHLSGTDDRIVPSFIAEKYVKVSNSNCVRSKLIPGVSHTKGWEKLWPAILKSM